MYLEKFKRVRSDMKVSARHAYNTYLLKTEEDIRSDPLQFWTFIQAKRQTTKIPGELAYNGERLSDPQVIVDGFANYFQSVYVGSGGMASDAPTVNELESFDIGQISEKEIVVAI